MSSDHSLTRRVRTAHGDAWQLEGRLREPFGGGAAELPGIRLMASGIPTPQWNNGDVTDPAVVDLGAVREWYADKGVPWGVRVPEGMSWSHGRHLFRKACMTLPLAAKAAGDHPPPGADVVIVPAGPADLHRFAEVDATAFGDDVALTTRWIEPHLRASGVLSALALLRGEPVGVATGVRTSGDGGECLAVFGVGVLPHARGRGIGTWLTTYVLDWGRRSGADLAWLNPDGDAARLYRRLGFIDTDGFDVYLDL